MQQKLHQQDRRFQVVPIFESSAFSLGVVLFEIVLWMNTSADETRGAIQMFIRTNRFPDGYGRGHFNVQEQAMIKDVIRRMTETQPEDRPTSSELLRDTRLPFAAAISGFCAQKNNYSCTHTFRDVVQSYCNFAVPGHRTPFDPAF